MYLNIQETAEYLELPVSEVERLIREGQVRTIVVDDEVLLNQEQFKLFLKEMERYKRELQAYLDEPIPEDVDIKDED